MKPHHEFGPFNQPTPHDGIDPNPAAGDPGIKRKEYTRGDVEGEIKRLQEYAAGTVEKHGPAESATFNGDVVDHDGSRRYIEEIISAKPRWALGVEGKTTELQGAAYVHTYAAKNFIDKEGTLPLNSENDVGGFFVQIGLEPDAYLFFLNTKSRGSAYNFHHTMVKLFAQKYTTIEDVYRIVEGVYEKENSSPDLPGPFVLMAGKKSMGTPSPTPQVVIEHTQEEVSAKVPQEVLEPSQEEVSAEPQVEKILENYTRAAYQRNHDAMKAYYHGAHGDTVGSIEMRGYLLPRRPVEGKRYIHEMLSASPGFYSIARAATRDIKRVHRTRESIKCYFISVGLYEDQCTVRVHSTDPDAVRALQSTLVSYVTSKMGDEQLTREKINAMLHSFKEELENDPASPLIEFM